MSLCKGKGEESMIMFLEVPFTFKSYKSFETRLKIVSKKYFHIEINNAHCRIVLSNTRTQGHLFLMCGINSVYSWFD